MFLVCLQQQIRIHRVTKWILLNLAVFDLISCLVNRCPAIFLVVVVQLSQGSVVHILSVTAACVEIATRWGNCACVVLLATVCKDATVRAFLSQRITIQRLIKLLLVIWLIYVFTLCGLLYSYHDLSFVLWQPRTFRKMIAKRIPHGPILISITVLATRYVMKCYYDIRKYLKTHNNVIQSHISASMNDAGAYMRRNLQE